MTVQLNHDSQPGPAPVGRNWWPYAIIGWFVLFVSAAAVWIVFAVRQDMDLVRRDYYEEELRFQRQLDRINRTAAVAAEVHLALEDAGRRLRLALPAAHGAKAPTGRIHFYRPSDARLDFEVPLAIDASGRQQVGVDHVRPGLWKVSVQWRVDGDEFFFDRALVLGVGVGG